MRKSPSVLLAWVLAFSFPSQPRAEEAPLWRPENPSVQDVFVPGREAARLSPDTAILARLGAIPALHLRADGAAAFSLKVDKGRENFLTLVYWGGDAAGQRRKGEDGKEIILGNPGIDVFVSGSPLSAEAVGFANEYGNQYEILADQPAMPGKWFMRTYRLLRNLTDGKDSIEVVVRAKKNSGGAYSSLGGAKPKPADPNTYTQGLFAAFTHTANFFDAPLRLPPVPESVSPAAPGELPAVDFAAVRQRLVAQIDNAVGELMKRQLYGPEFRQAATDLGIPPAVDGLFDANGLSSYLKHGRSQKAGAVDWKTPVTGSAGGRPHSVVGYLMMRAYGLPESRYHGDDEMIRRSIAALDGYCRYQGSDGGFEIGGGEWGWIGGPDRKTTRGGLQGFFASSVALTFLALDPYLEAHPELLAEKIDSDGDGKVDLARGDAYTALFVNYLKGQLDLRGGVANQARINAIGAIDVNRAVLKLSPKDALPAEVFDKMVREATGIEPHAFTGNWQMTRKGTSVEKGGLCPTYSQHAIVQFPLLIDGTGDQEIENRYRIALAAYAYFIFPVPTSTGSEFFVEGPVGSRHHPFPGRPLEWTPFAWSAVKLDDPLSQIVVMRRLAESKNLSDWSLGADDQARLPRRTLDALAFLDLLGPIQEMYEARKSGDLRLPIEKPDAFLFSDEEATLAALHDAGATLYLQAERYHLIRPQFEAFGAASFEGNPAARVDRFGPWTLARNLSDTPSIKDTGEPGIVVLPSSDPKTPGRGLVLLPAETRLLGPDAAEATALQFPHEVSRQAGSFRWSLKPVDAGEWTLVALPDEKEVREALAAFQSGARNLTTTEGGQALIAAPVARISPPVLAFKTRHAGDMLEITLNAASPATPSPEPAPAK